MSQFTSSRRMRVPASAPRNPLVAPALKRHAGRHQSPNDAQAIRQQARLELRRLLRESLPDDSP